MYNLILLNSAKLELYNAIAFYNTREDKLGKLFSKNAFHLIETILSNPKLFVKVKKEYRQALIKKFPFVIVYKIDDKTKLLLLFRFFTQTVTQNISTKIKII